MSSFDTGFWDELNDHWKEGGEAEADNMDYSLLPEGDYDVRIAKWHFMESAEKKTPGMNVEFNVMHPDHSSRLLWHTFWLTPKNLPYVMRDIRLITGHRISKPSELQDIDLSGLYVRVHVEHETYNDKTNARVKRFMPVAAQPVGGEPSGGGEPAF